MEDAIPGEVVIVIMVIVDKSPKVGLWVPFQMAVNYGL